MRLRLGILTLAIVAAVSGCGGSDKPKADASTAPSSAETSASGDSTSGSVPCAKFLASQTKASELYSKLASRSGDPSSLEDAAKVLKAQFDALKEGAPSDVVDALTDLEGVYDLYLKVVKDPASVQSSDYSGLGERLAKDSQTVGTYVSSHCSS